MWRGPVGFADINSMWMFFFLSSFNTTKSSLMILFNSLNLLDFVRKKFMYPGGAISIFSILSIASKFLDISSAINKGFSIAFCLSD